MFQLTENKVQNIPIRQPKIWPPKNQKYQAMSVQVIFRNTSALVARSKIMYSTAQCFRFIEKSQISQLINSAE